MADPLDRIERDAHAVTPSPDHAATVREQLRHLGPWRGAVGDEALDALVAALAQAEQDRDEARKVANFRKGEADRWYTRAMVRYERAERAERERDQAVDALKRARMRAIDAYNECGISAPQDHFLRDIENIARDVLDAIGKASSPALEDRGPRPSVSADGPSGGPAPDGAGDEGTLDAIRKDTA